MLVLLPLAWTAWEASQADPAEAAALLIRPLVGALLLHTLGLAAASVLVCLVLGTACAWCVERTTLPGRRGFAVLAAVPLAIPPFVTSYAWVSLSPALQDFAGALLVVCSAYMPLAYLPVAAALRGMDPALEESGRALGLGPWACFRRVVLPQLRNPLLGAAVLVALNVLVEFGAFALLRYRTFTTELYAEYRTGFAGPDSALLAMVLVGLCLGCLALEAGLRGRARYAVTTRGASRMAPRHRLGAWTLPVLAFFTALVCVTLAVPLGTVVWWMTRHNGGAVTVAAASLPALAAAASSSVSLALAAALVTTLLALPLALAAVRRPGRWIAVLERCAYLGQGVPGIVVALALVALSLRWLPALYQTAAMLVAAYAILFLPLAVVSLRATLQQIRPGLEEMGRVLGLGPLAAFRRILLPLAGPGLGAAAALVFVSVVTELTATLLLAPIGTRTLATQVWADTTSLAFAAAAPYAFGMSALSLSATWLLARRFGRGTGATR